MPRTVKIEYPDGTTRDVEPASCEVRDGQPPRPVFNPSSWRIVETVDGRYLIVRARED